MNLDFTEADEQFRAEVRAFFEREYPRYILDKLANGQSLTKADLLASEAALQSRGWLAASWPVEYGGTGWSVAERFIFDEEMQRAGAPLVVPMGLLYLGPILCVFGSDEQRSRWLPDILSGRTFWAQGYSEPDAGSDLASLRTRATRDGDSYVVQGEKVWTSQAQFADWIFCLVRTNDAARKQDGISMLCIDMRSPGVAVHPIVTIDGAHVLNRVTFDNVRVPLENLVGEEGKAWSYSQALLSHERTSYARLGLKRRDIRDLAQRIAEETDPALAEAERRRHAELEITSSALEMTVFRVLAPLAAGQAPGPVASLLKIMATELSQAITELRLDVAGASAMPFAPDRSGPNWTDSIGGADRSGPLAAAAYFAARAETIYGGSTEIQKNIIARQLGL